MTTMLQLPKVTLVAMGSTNIEGMLKALQYSCEDLRWGAVKLVTDGLIRFKASVPQNPEMNTIEIIDTAKQMNSIDDWNKAIIYDLGKYIDTEFALLIHPDGFVVNPQSWRDDFLEYDFIGAPWPLPQDDFSYRTPDGEIVRVGNSVSLRSKKLLDLPSKLGLEWKEFYGNTNEDGFLCCHNRRILEENGCFFAPIEIAKYFSHETPLPELEGIVPFAFHRHAGANWKYPDFENNCEHRPDGTRNFRMKAESGSPFKQI